MGASLRLDPTGFPGGCGLGVPAQRPATSPRWHGAAPLSELGPAGGGLQRGLGGLPGPRSAALPWWELCRGSSPASVALKPSGKRLGEQWHRGSCGGGGGGAGMGGM